MLFHKDAKLLIDLFLVLSCSSWTSLPLSLGDVWLQSLSVSQRIQSMICRAVAWVDTGQHHDLYLFTCKERVSQNHGQLALSKWNMLALGTLCFLGIKSSHALFESKQGLVDLCTLRLSLFVVALAVLGSLTSSQINKKQLSTLSHSFLLDFDLGDSVRPTGSVICLRGMSGPDRVSLLDQLKDLVIIVYELFS